MRGMIDMRHLFVLKRRIGGERGSVLLTALIVLFILTALVGVTVGVAVKGSTSTTRDSETKAALEAAEAGLQTATYRLTKLEPKAAECITGTATTTPPSGGYCVGPQESLGNGATFKYWTTPELTSGQACTGPAVTPPRSGDIGVQRCVTAVGTVDGVPRRVQERVFALLATPLFEVEGILGYHSVTVKQNGRLEGEIGTNGIVKLENGSTVTKTDLGPSGKVEGGGFPGTIATNSSPFVPPPVPIGKSAESAKTIAECGAPTLGTEAGENCDLLITNGINRTHREEDPASGVTFNAATRSLSMGNGASLELYEGIYNFCDFQVPGNNATLKTALGARVQIFIDSAQRAGSGCQNDIESGALQAGKLVFNNGLTLENPNKNATYLQIYVYDGSGGTVAVKNNSTSAFYGTIVAPKSKIEINNNGSFTGAIEANEVELVNNFQFKWDINDQGLKQEMEPQYERKTWAECTPTFTGSPQAGC